MSQSPRLLHELVRRGAERTPERRAHTFVTDAGERYFSYQDLDRRARALAAYLQAEGLAGERVLLLYEPGLDFIVAFFACQYAGAVAVPAYPPEPARLARTLPRLVAIVRDTQARGLLTTAFLKSAAPMLATFDPGLSQLHWIATDGPALGDASAWREPARAPGDTAFLQYTSGSTGTPKGVVVSHEHILTNVAQLGEAVDGVADDVFCSWVPFYHDMGLVGRTVSSRHCRPACWSLGLS